MGCGAAGNKGDHKFDEFFEEAYGFKKKDQKGLDIEDSNEVQTTIQFGISRNTINFFALEHNIAAVRL